MPARIKGRLVRELSATGPHGRPFVVEVYANGTIRVREKGRRTYYTTTASAIFWEGAKADAGFSGKAPRGLTRRDPLPRKAKP